MPNSILATLLLLLDKVWIRALNFYLLTLLFPQPKILENKILFCFHSSQVQLWLRGTLKLTRSAQFPGVFKMVVLSLYELRSSLTCVHAWTRQPPTWPTLDSPQVDVTVRGCLSPGRDLIWSQGTRGPQGPFRGVCEVRLVPDCTNPLLAFSESFMNIRWIFPEPSFWQQVASVIVRSCDKSISVYFPML